MDSLNGKRKNNRNIFSKASLPANKLAHSYKNKFQSLGLCMIVGRFNISPKPIKILK